MEQIFKNRPNKIYGRQPLKNLKGHGLPKADHARGGCSFSKKSVKNLKRLVSASADNEEKFRL